MITKTGRLRRARKPGQNRRTEVQAVGALIAEIATSTRRFSACGGEGLASASTLEPETFKDVTNVWQY